ncbi:uncharacterized protein LOC119688854 [Teleopsis dalmanni]|uniref:uncharacterized protein LOC119688854 n=1 Tax=Teleopsis dalmanni TaxID=139649 RepID=UPI0018CCE909|nr:uncharacterized protein LOC119688854 [Teleopsis dalmanni]
MIKSSISGNATKPESITLKYKGDGTSVSPKDRQYGGDTIFQNNGCPLTSEQFLRARQKFVLLENANSTNDGNASAGKDVNKNKNSSKPVEANRKLPKEFAETSYSTINIEHEINPRFQPLLYEGDVDFGMSPKSTFKRKEKDVTFVDYYKQPTHIGLIVCPRENMPRVQT